MLVLSENAAESLSSSVNVSSEGILDFNGQSMLLKVELLLRVGGFRLEPDKLLYLAGGSVHNVS